MERNACLDICKGIAILMVINVHLESGELFLVGKTFHVSLFFLVSGIIKGMNEHYPSNNIEKIYKSKIKSLMYPYISLSVVSIIINIIISLIKQKSVLTERVLSSILKTVSFQGIGTLWFLPIMFLAELLGYCGIKFCRQKYYVCLVGNMLFIVSVIAEFVMDKAGLIGINTYRVDSYYGILFSGLLTMLCTTFLATGLLMVGFGLSDIFNKISKSKHNSSKLFLVMVSSYFLLKYFVVFYVGDIHKAEVGNPIIFILCVIFGNLFAIDLSILISKIKYLRDIIGFLGRNSLIIMTTHKEFYITTIVYLIFRRLGESSTITSILSFISIIIIEVIIINLIEKCPLKFLYIPPAIKVKEVKR